MPKQRKIIHIDMDAFYAAVEQRENPDFRDRPVIVGGTVEQRGVVATCSYEARQYGVHSAMSTAQALQLCPEAIVVQPNMPLYLEISEHIQNICQDYTQHVEPIALDEAYLDVSDNAEQHSSAMVIAQDIKQRIAESLQLTASAGVSYNKFLAKMASDLEKPDGLTTIEPGQGEAFVARLPIGAFHGIGKATEQKMLALGIRNGDDLKAWSQEKLVDFFGKAGAHFYHLARGQDDRVVQPNRARKSIGCETTFPIDILDFAELQNALAPLALTLSQRLQTHQLEGVALTLKVKYADFTQVTRRCTLPTPICEAEPMMKLLPYLLQRTQAGQRPVRLLGVSLSNLSPLHQRSGPRQLSLDL